MTSSPTCQRRTLLPIAQTIPAAAEPAMWNGCLGTPRGDPGCAGPAPNAFVLPPPRHHEHQHLVLADQPSGHHFELHRLIGRPVALFANYPGMHLFRNVAARRNLADLIEVLERSNALHLGDGWHRNSPCPFVGPLLTVWRKKCCSAIWIIAATAASKGCDFG